MAQRPKIGKGGRPREKWPPALLRALRAVRWLEMRGKPVTFSNIMRASGLSPRSVAKALNIARRRGWVTEKKCGEFKVLFFDWELVPLEAQIRAQKINPVTRIAEQLSNERDALLFHIILEELYDDYGDERMRGTEWGHLTFSSFIHRYYNDVIKIIEKRRRGQPLTENEYAKYFALICFAEDHGLSLPL
jgi:DNA-binding transcriptional ArsR family regulator